MASSGNTPVESSSTVQDIHEEAAGKLEKGRDSPQPCSSSSLKMKADSSKSLPSPRTAMSNESYMEQFLDFYSEDTEEIDLSNYVEFTDDAARGGNTKHPLLIPEVLDVVFDYLRYDQDFDYEDTLHTCQYVCKLWKDMITKKLETAERYHVEIPSKLSLDHSFMQIVKSIPTHRRSFSITMMPNTFMKYFCKEIGSQMTSLHVALNYMVDSSNGNLYTYLSRFCFKLTELSIDLSDCRGFTEEASQKNICIPVRTLEGRHDFTRNRRVLQNLCLPRCPYLQNVRFAGDTSQFIQFMTSVLDDAQKSDRITTLEFYCQSRADVGKDFILFFRKYRWNSLKKLNLRFVHNVNISVVRDLLSHLSTSLETLVVEFDNPDVSFELPVEQNFLIPLNMPKLRHISVNEQSTKALINALCLPQLRSCECTYSVMGRGDFFKQIWSESEVQWKFHEHMLESLTIHENSLDLPVFQLTTHPFHCLKNLHLEHASNTMLEVIFSTQAILERLKLQNVYSLKVPAWDWKSEIDLSCKSIDWDELVTGLKKPTPIKHVKKLSRRHSKQLMLPLEKIGPSIVNLKNLQYLHITFESSSNKLTDFTVHHGLAHLKNLQFVELNQVKFSKSAMNALESQLLPFCRLILHKKRRILTSL